MISPYLNKPLRSLQQAMSQQPVAAEAVARPAASERPGVPQESLEEDGISVVRGIDG